MHLDDTTNLPHRSRSTAHYSRDTHPVSFYGMQVPTSYLVVILLSLCPWYVKKFAKTTFGYHPCFFSHLSHRFALLTNVRPSTTLHRHINTNTMKKNIEGGFPIRAYGKRELAQHYFPAITPEAASKQLQHWIVQCTELHQALIDLHYMPRQRLLTPQQVKLIIYYLGEP